MAKQASLVVWYGLSIPTDVRVIGGLPETSHQQLLPHTTHVFPTCKQIAAIAQDLIGPQARLVYHGQEFQFDRYGLAATESVRTVSAWEAPISPQSLTVEKGWHETLVAAARILKWPAGPMRWWMAASLLDDGEY